MYVFLSSGFSVTRHCVVKADRVKTLVHIYLTRYIEVRNPTPAGIAREWCHLSTIASTTQQRMVIATQKGMSTYQGRVNPLG